MSGAEVEIGLGGPSGLRTALIVGAGVSGCACGATLAARGVGVTVLSSALDNVGHPAFGPELVGGRNGWSAIAEVLEALPRELRDVWVEAALASDEAPFVSVDRRMLGVESKRVLEGMRGLEFRQGVANDLRVVVASERGAGRGERMLAVETAFGEVFEAGAVVVGVGLSLGGRVTVGENEMVGGRYGEACSDGLRAALEKLGAKFAERAIEVGPRFAEMAALAERAGAPSGGPGRVAPGGPAPQEVVLDVPLRRLREGGLSGPVQGRAIGDLAMGEANVIASWPEDYPQSPYGVEELWGTRAVVARTSDGSQRLLILPDGLATGEVALGTGWEGAARGEARSQGQPAVGLMASRLGYLVRGLSVCNLERNGRVAAEDGASLPVWVIGRAGGADGYLESLSSGVRAGVEIARVLGLGG
jgi:hypothetical protein